MESEIISHVSQILRTRPYLLFVHDADAILVWLNARFPQTDVVDDVAD